MSFMNIFILASASVFQGEQVLGRSCWAVSQLLHPPPRNRLAADVWKLLESGPRGNGCAWMGGEFCGKPRGECEGITSKAAVKILNRCTVYGVKHEHLVLGAGVVVVAVVVQIMNPVLFFSSVIKKEQHPNATIPCISAVFSLLLTLPGMH